MEIEPGFATVRFVVGGSARAARIGYPRVGRIQTEAHRRAASSRRKCQNGDSYSLGAGAQSRWRVAALDVLSQSDRDPAAGSARSSDPTFNPSGEQVEISREGQRAVAVEVGGALRSYTVGGREMLDGYAAHERCTGARGQTLIPWPNRLRDGTYEFAGRHHQLPLSEPAKHNAIHGLVRWVNWAVVERAGDRVVMGHVLRPQAGWPFALGLRIAYVLGPAGLLVSTTATNVGPDPCPYGAGAHPYLQLGTASVSSLVLQAPGRSHMPADDRGIPTSTERVDGTIFDFLQPRELGATELDTAYSELLRDDDGLARVRLATADGSRRVTLWLDEHYRFLMLFTGDSLRNPARRRRGLGVEAMTCAPNALQSADGLRTLAPGEALTSCWGIAPG